MNPTFSPTEAPHFTADNVPNWLLVEEDCCKDENGTFIDILDPHL